MTHGAPLSTAQVRCSDCGRLLATYHRVPPDARAHARLENASRDLLDWHRAEGDGCPATKAIVGAAAAGTRTQE